MHSALRPAVTVLTPVFGEGLYIDEALESLSLEMTRARSRGIETEALVVLDRPTARTRGVVAEVAGRVAGMRVEESPGIGLTNALNHGLSLARGTYLARFDSDDVMLPGRLAAQTQALASNGELVLVGGQVQRWCAGRVHSLSALPLSHDGIHHALRRGRHAINHSSCMIRLTAITEVSGYEVPGPAEDWDLYLRLARVGRLANLPQPVTLYRYHADSVTGSEALKVQLGIQLAIVRDRVRAVDPMSDLAATSLDRHPVRSLRARRRAASQIWYRRAMGAGSRTVEWSALFLAGLLDPTAAWERVRRDWAAGRARAHLAPSKSTQGLPPLPASQTALERKAAP